MLQAGALHLLEVSEQQMCIKYCSSSLFAISVAGLMLKCWPLHKLVDILVFTSNKATVLLATDLLYVPGRAQAVLPVTCNI